MTIFETAPSFCLALTGGIACGKSTVGARLAHAGLHRVDSDQVARQVVLPGTPGLAGVVQLFGEGVLLPDGTMDRRAVGQRVFASERARRDLESLLHPLIWKVMSDEMAVAADTRRETVFEIPLLYENGNESRFSTVWVVAVSRGVQLQRLQDRDRLSFEEAQARLDSQMDVEEKARRADYVIRNEGAPEALDAAIAQGLARWREARA